MALSQPLVPGGLDDQQETVQPGGRKAGAPWARHDVTELTAERSGLAGVWCSLGQPGDIVSGTLLSKSMQAHQPAKPTSHIRTPAHRRGCPVGS